MKYKGNNFKLVKYTLGIAIIFIFVYFGIMPFISGGKNMKSFCETISPGMALSDVKVLAEKHNYRIVERNNRGKNTIKIIDTAAMGRFICEVSFIQGSVVDAEYIHND